METSGSVLTGRCNLDPRFKSPSFAQLRLVPPDPRLENHL